MKKRTILAMICLCLGIFFGAVGLYKYIEEKNAGKEYEELREEVVEKEEIQQEETQDIVEIETPPVNIPIDFKTLQQQNPDVYAWIQIPNTAVDYPILQSAVDNAYYLNHTIDGKEKKKGLFLQKILTQKPLKIPILLFMGMI